MPDVMVSFQGLRCVLEGKMGDTQNAQVDVADDIRDRIENGIAHIAIGVVYPVFLRNTSFANLHEALTNSTLDFLVCSEAGSGDWRQGTLDTILNELRRSYDTLVRDDVLARAVERLEIGMRSLVDVLSSNTAASTRLAEVLGVYQKEESEDYADE